VPEDCLIPDSPDKGLDELQASRFLEPEFGWVCVFNFLPGSAKVSFVLTLS
jgi:hypothetical protein